MIEVFIVATVVYLIGAFLSYGATFNALQMMIEKDAKNIKTDRVAALLMALLSIFGVLVVWIFSGSKYPMGLMYKTHSSDQLTQKRSKIGWK